MTYQSETAVIPNPAEGVVNFLTEDGRVFVDFGLFATYGAQGLLAQVMADQSILSDPHMAGKVEGQLSVFEAMKSVVETVNLEHAVSLPSE